MKAIISTVALLWAMTIPCAEAIHGLYSFSQHELFYKKNSCKQIPANLLLCHDIEYTEMRLPNLLGHETMNEVLQQASSWIPLVQKQCHPDTRKFLCSLFAPVCLDDLDEPIQPCRSLCESVRNSCAPVMSAFGFPWPKMLDCERFPLDNDLCIPPASMDNFVPVTKEGEPPFSGTFFPQKPLIDARVARLCNSLRLRIGCVFVCVRVRVYLAPLSAVQCLFIGVDDVN